MTIKYNRDNINCEISWLNTRYSLVSKIIKVSAGWELKYLFYVFTCLTSISSLDSIASFGVINMKLNNCVKKHRWHNLSLNMEISQKKLNENKTDIHNAWMLHKTLKVCNFLWHSRDL